MNDLLGDYLNQFILVFLDDVLIYSTNAQDHAKQLKKVLGRLWGHCLCAKSNNYKTFKSSVTFLSQQICSGSMTPTQAKLKIVWDWATQKTYVMCNPSWGLQTITKGLVPIFCSNCRPLEILNKERSDLVVGTPSMMYLLIIKGCFIHCTNFIVPRPQAPLRCSY